MEWEIDFPHEKWDLCCRCTDFSFAFFIFGLCIKNHKPFKHLIFDTLDIVGFLQNFFFCAVFTFILFFSCISYISSFLLA